MKIAPFLTLFVLVFAMVTSECDKEKGTACVAFYKEDLKREEEEQSAKADPDYTKICGYIQKILKCAEVPIKDCSEKYQQEFEEKMRDMFESEPYNCTGLTFDPDPPSSATNRGVTFLAVSLVAAIALIFIH